MRLLFFGGGTFTAANIKGEVLFSSAISLVSDLQVLEHSCCWRIAFAALAIHCIVT